jgi:hypothetical protein
MQYKFINYRPVYLIITRRLRFAALCLLISLTLGTLSMGVTYLSVRPIKDEALRQFDETEFQKLQLAYSSVKAGKEKNLSLLDAMSQSKKGIQLDRLLSVTDSYKPQGVNILTISSETITGCGPSLDVVTQFIKQLSDELGTEVDAKNIRQLVTFGSAVGFELEF